MLQIYVWPRYLCNPPWVMDSVSKFWILPLVQLKKCDWANRRIMTMEDGTWTRYEYYNNTSRYITQLTHEIIQNQELCKLLQQISQVENSSIPYFKQNISDYDEKNYIEPDVPNFPYPRPRWTCCPNIPGISYILFIITKFLYMLN